MALNGVRRFKSYTYRQIRIGMNYDIVNASFEGIGATLCWLNFKALLRDKRVAGINWGVVLFFAVWGVWNTAFYSHLEQWWSLVAGIGLALGNLAWVVLAVHYIYFKDKK